MWLALELFAGDASNTIGFSQRAHTKAALASSSWSTPRAERVAVGASPHAANAGSIAMTAARTALAREVMVENIIISSSLESRTEQSVRNEKSAGVLLPP